MNLTVKKGLMEIIKSPGQTCRLTRDLPDGRMIILQVVDPNRDPRLAKWLRKKADSSKAVRVLHAAETANRVAGYVFRNIMRKEVREEM